MTFHYALNYGAILQYWALKNVLEKRGHKVWLIDRVPNQNNNLRTFVGRLKTRILPNKEFKSWCPFRLEVESIWGNRTRRYYSSKAMKMIQKYQLEAIIVGSDQVWRDEYTLADNNYFLDFLPQEDSARRISYAASFGTDGWTASIERLAKVKRCLQRFDAVSVRESSGVDICRDVFGVEATWVLDPTLLLEFKDYHLLMLKSTLLIQKDYVISYFLGSMQIREESCNFMKEWSTRHHLEYADLFQVNSATQSHYTVSEWLSMMNNAKYVVTNSYHATIFAILAHKPFVVIDLASGGTTRLRSLLSMFGLEKRLVSSLVEIDKVLENSLNYKDIDSVLNRKRKDSISFIEKAGL